MPHQNLRSLTTTPTISTDSLPFTTVITTNSSATAASAITTTPQLSYLTRSTLKRLSQSDLLGQLFNTSKKAKTLLQLTNKSLYPIDVRAKLAYMVSRNFPIHAACDIFSRLFNCFQLNCRNNSPLPQQQLKL